MILMSGGTTRTKGFSGILWPETLRGTHITLSMMCRWFIIDLHLSPSSQSVRSITPGGNNAYPCKPYFLHHDFFACASLFCGSQLLSRAILSPCASGENLQYSADTRQLKRKIPEEGTLIQHLMHWKGRGVPSETTASYPKPVHFSNKWRPDD